MIWMGLHGYACHAVARPARPVCGGTCRGMGGSEVPDGCPQRPRARHQSHLLGPHHQDKVITDSKEVAAKELPPERQVAHAERQAGATPTKVDVTSTSTGATLYPDWMMRSKTKPIGRDTPRPYRMPREDTSRGLMLEEELDAASMFDPLQLASQ